MNPSPTMLTWEYQVIRLNIEPPVAAAPEQSPADETDAKDKQAKVFSEAYLKEEFPRFYDSSLQGQGQSQQPQEVDPAFQLQDFLNSQGQQGWELVGFQHANPHVFIVFKRPVGNATGEQPAHNEQLRLTLDLANRALAIIEKQAG